ncbi:MAG: Haloacetate dehalogenase H-1 [Pseudomonas fluorescens]|nr:MAG: Haloacetate dehalogenase H-1 [Pseudomonas fluorescens]
MSHSLFRTKTKNALQLSLLTALLLGGAVQAADKPWELLPPTPANTATFQTAEVNGIQLAYSIAGEGTPLVVLHGGPANSDYLANQVQLLARHYKVISVDTRGHGRSSQGEQPLGYDLFANDVAALMSKLGVARADFLGWSDGGITALDLAMRYPDKVGRVVVFGANVDTTGAFPDSDKNLWSPPFLQY